MRLRDMSLRIAWAVTLAALLAATAVALYGGPATIALLVLATIGSAAWGFATLRAVRFHHGLRTFLRRLLASDYDTGVRLNGPILDDLTDTARLCNRLASQLRTYDELRADRVCLTHRALDLVLQSTETGILLYDVAKQAMRINAPLQRLLGSDKSRFARAILRDIAGNAPFFAALDDVVTQRTGEIQVDTRIRLPGSGDAVPVSLRLIPVKGLRETVEMVLGVATPPSGQH